VLHSGIKERNQENDDVATLSNEMLAFRITQTERYLRMSNKTIIFDRVGGHGTLFQESNAMLHKFSDLF
jgi:hypothetical protein